jgi:3-isopropylmalate/(R)-2-methylmalate dehydratase small subunit
MEKLSILKGRCLPIDSDDVDTDQIIPAKFLMRVTRKGLGEHAFANWSGNAIIKSPERAQAPIVLAGANFGCGSSREHAVWALRDRGIKVVIAESLADIFANNCARFGVLAFTLEPAVLRELRAASTADAGFELEVDLPAQSLRTADGRSWSFEVDPFVKHCLIEGLDLIGLSLQAQGAISDYEGQRPRYRPRTTTEVARA